MKTIRKETVFLVATVIFGLITMFYVAWSYDFSFYDAKTYESMSDLVALLQEEVKPYDIEKYDLEGISDYTWEYSYTDNVYRIEMNGTKFEQVNVELEGDTKRISLYKIEKKYGLSFWTALIIVSVGLGCVPAAIITIFWAITEMVVKRCVKRKKIK